MISFCMTFDLWTTTFLLLKHSTPHLISLLTTLAQCWKKKRGKNNLGTSSIFHEFSFRPEPLLQWSIDQAAASYLTPGATAAISSTATNSAWIRDSALDLRQSQPALGVLSTLSAGMNLTFATSSSCVSWSFQLDLSKLKVETSPNLIKVYADCF